ncbi:hypothetical protein DLM45_11920 [Hyphomicrobium methylovorum]|uniref:hypothetical protein n=1 Tax=Hyphomicrobium methylovorum TaxID=84 RepID=UPI0015E6D95F|nr:hypothetical protein [Hyphomicrobium methylovorum]MBA2126920.1 hypothetical protein [Hyphomicrobium methylovorum]
MSAFSPAATATPDFGPLTDESDDLPRTLRREKEARARAARERAAAERAAAPSLSGLSSASADDDYERPRPQIFRAAEFAPARDERPPAATVTRLDIPFRDLTLFFLKAVLASIPALILLGVILWFAGWALEAIFPQLIKMKILISFPN